MRFFVFFLTIAIFTSSSARNKKVIYEEYDSIKVESLLKQSLHLDKKKSKTLWFARQFLGLPYVAHTLEVGDEENLVVNLRELDCTTYIDVVVALTLASNQGLTKFSDFCKFLRHQRYPNGIISDYTSRNHYFSTWILHGTREGRVKEIGKQDNKGKNPFTATQTIQAFYMSKHPDSYKHLKAHPEYIKGIRAQENEISGTKVAYIPNANLGWTKKQLNCIQTGDILALVTKAEGLEISHLGIAVWNKNGTLHLLNASSKHKKVLIDPDTMKQYMERRKNNLGVRVLRVL